MRRTIALVGATAAVLTTMAPVSFADAATRHRHHHYRSYAAACQRERHSAATKGAIIGTVGGALIGNSLSHGNRLPGTLLGAGAGAYVGHQIGKHNSGCR